MLLCETWLNDSSPILQVPGYHLELTNRTTKTGGGVAILIADNIQYRWLPTPQPNDNYEACFIDVKTKNKNYIVGSLYRPPNTNPDEFTNWLRTALLQFNNTHEIILCMDHNMDLLKADIHKPTQRFLDCILEAGLMPSIIKPTRLSHTTATLIDNIIIDQRRNGNYESFILMDNTSDHLPCVTILDNIQTCKKDYIKVTGRDNNKTQMIHLKNSLEKLNFDEILATTSLEKKTQRLINSISKEINHFLPIKSKLIRFKHLWRDPWITSALMKSMNKSKHLYKKSLQGNDNTRISYKNYNDTLKKVKHHAKKQYYIDKCTEYKSNTRQLWTTINRLIKTQNDKTSTVSQIQSNGIEISNPQVISKKFCSYFSNIGKHFASKIPSPDKTIDHYLTKIWRNENSLFLLPTTETEVLKLIRNLPNKRSSGHDDIDNVLLKEIAMTISNPLTKLFNESLSSGIFPDIFKLAEVIPLHKNGPRDQITNYRPILLLMTISKILEKIFYTRMYNFLTNSNQLYQSQYGFRAKHSCDHAVGELLSDIVKNLELNKPTVCLYLDLSKAFDTLLHTVILKKLERYGIRGNCLQWMESYLSNRKMLVKCRTDNGDIIKLHPQHVTYGTPQGSCLGPLLFLIFCNDLQLHLIHLRAIQFADDTTLYMSHRKVQYLEYCINNDLRRVEDWFWANKLTLNAMKTVAMIFNCNKKNVNEPWDTTKSINSIQLVLNDITIPKVESTKFLGMWIDNRLSWKTHLAKITAKLKTKLCMLQKGKNLLTTHAKKILYFAQFQSVITYGLVIWGNMVSNTHMNQLQRLQDKAVKLIAPHHNLSQIYEQHRILQVQQLITLENIKMWYKHKHNLLPSKLQENMGLDHKNTTLKKTHHYNTRQKATVNLPLAKTKHYKTSFFSCGLSSFQKVPDPVKNARNISVCTKTAKCLLLSKSNP